MKSVNHKIQPYIWAIIVIVVAFILFWFTGCNPIKKAERQDEKAVLRVNANSNLQSKVASQWLDAHPPIEGKPEIKYLPGTVQIKEIPVTDYKALQKAKDSLIKALGDSCKDYSITAYEAGYDQAEKYYKANPFIRVDTKEIYTPDLREANRYRDSFNNYKNTLSFVRGQLSFTQDKLKETEHKNRNMYLWIIGLSVGLVLSHVVRSYLPSMLSKIKPSKL